MRPEKKHTTKLVNPVKLYVCDCHGEPANKPPCRNDAEPGAFSQSPLGKWRCPVTDKKCKVKVRSKAAAQ